MSMYGIGQNEPNWAVLTKKASVSINNSGAKTWCRVNHQLWHLRVDNVVSNPLSDTKGPCKKYVTPKRAIFEPPSPPMSHFVIFSLDPPPPMSLTKKWQTFYWKKYINTACIGWYIEGKSVTCDESMKTAMIKWGTNLSNATLSANE